VLLVPTAAATNAKAFSLDARIAYTKQQVKHDKRVIKKFKHRLHGHEQKLAQLQELRRIFALSPISAIMYVFGSHGPEAVNVAACESGGGVPANIDIHAKNGQYDGMFQMGINERAHYATIGYSTPYQQAVAAFNYFVDAKGWAPWECSP
jgi:hypothetical protein